MLCSCPSFLRKQESRPPAPGLWMPDQSLPRTRSGVRHDESVLARLQLIVNRANGALLPVSWSSFPSCTRLLCAVLAVLPLLLGGTVHAQTSEIDILVVYTTAAKEAAGGKSSIEAEIDLMVTEANTAFSESEAHLQLRLVHVEELDYVEPPDSHDLYRLALPGDGHMDEVHALRDAVGADLVHLIEEWGVDSRSPYCGRSLRRGHSSAGAYAVTVRACGSLTFAHEVGHNLGLLHDRYTSMWRPMRITVKSTITSAT